MASDGNAFPYSPGANNRRQDMTRVRQVVGYLDQRQEQTAARLAEVARFHEVESRLPVPPTTAPARQPVNADTAAS